MRLTGVLSLTLVLGCSSGSGGDDPLAPGGGNAGSAAGSTSTASAGGGATGSGGSNSAGTGAGVSPAGAGGGATSAGAGGTGVAGASAASGEAGAAGSGAGSGGAAPQGAFTCSEVLGLTLTKEWYVAGFEQGVVDGKWQLKAAQSAYVDEWAKSDSPFWATPVVSPCEVGSTAPDHVVFAVLSWTIMTQADWEKAIGGAVTSIKSKYPGVARIELMTIVRGPGNAACGDPNVYAENTHIPAALDAALAKVAAGSPALVHVAPQFSVDSCADFKGTGPHLTDAGNAKLAAKIATAFASVP
jgi:hypothetical protein